MRSIELSVSLLSSFLLSPRYKSVLISISFVHPVAKLAFCVLVFKHVYKSLIFVHFDGFWKKDELSLLKFYSLHHPFQQTQRTQFKTLLSLKERTKSLEVLLIIFDRNVYFRKLLTQVW